MSINIDISSTTAPEEIPISQVNTATEAQPVQTPEIPIVEPGANAQGEQLSNGPVGEVAEVKGDVMADATEIPTKFEDTAMPQVDESPINGVAVDETTLPTTAPVAVAPEFSLKETSPEVLPSTIPSTTPPAALPKDPSTVTETATTEILPADTIPKAPISDEQHLQPQSAADIDLGATSQTNGTSPEVKQEDTAMAEVGSPVVKVAREREEDMNGEDEPVAKRSRVDDGSGNATPQFATPEASSQANGESPAPASVATNNNDDGYDSLKMTEYQLKEITKAIRIQKNTKNGKNFKDPVEKLWPTFAEAYNAKVPNPIDLTILETKFKNGEYATLGEGKADIIRIYENALLFNGPNHEITISAGIVRDNIMARVPGPAPPKTVPKAKRPNPKPDGAARVPQARRPSAPKPMAAPTNGGSPPQTFALDPTNGTPLIRRDSTKVGENGRPKREIHPPKNKDLAYSVKPKKKKFATELRFCEHVLGELKKPRYITQASPFLYPVDPVALGIPTYFKVIRMPMDISTISEKLRTGQYENAKEFESDWRLMFQNCYKFNPVGSPVHEIGKAFEGIFDNEWSKKSTYLAEHGDPVNVAEPTDESEEDDDESEEEEIDDEPVTNAATAMAARLIEEQNKLIDLMGAKKADAALIAMQQQMVAFVKDQVEKENQKVAKSKKKVKVPKTIKKTATKSKKLGGTSKGYKVRTIGTAEKETISHGIGVLNEKEMQQAINLLKADYPDLNVEDEVEFDIDQFSTPTLSRLYDLISRTHPEMVQKKEPAAGQSRIQKSSKPKKNKPMSKTEQEMKIEHLKKLENQFKRAGSSSDDVSKSVVHPSVEQDSSGDEESSDSEED